MNNHDYSEKITAEVNQLIKSKTPIAITGNQSKQFLTGKLIGTPVSTAEHCGIIQYDPTELVVTVRSGTPLKDLKQILADNNQRLPFEPPEFNNATIGGTIACNLSGPARAWYGAARDCLLGVNMINGKGETLKFGGQVMKNVAGYDLSRLQAGAKGTLGLLLDVSIKVLPVFEQELTLSYECTADAAIKMMNQYAARPLPISATFYDGKTLFLRLSGNALAIQSTAKQMQAEQVNDATDFWESIREQSHPAFSFKKTLHRISIAANTPPLTDNCLMEWNGALRWISDEDFNTLTDKIKQFGGYINLFNSTPFQPSKIKSDSTIEKLSRSIKLAFDPDELLNQA
jgi:glycolate oxidase FAD binding subunit